MHRHNTAFLFIVAIFGNNVFPLDTVSNSIIVINEDL
jgi:hypothetical protein